jgi:hypothetical protein
VAAGEWLKTETFRKERIMAERKTNSRGAMIIAVGIAAATKIEAGKMAVINAIGFGAEGSEALNLKAIGRWCETVDNSAGLDGALIGEAEFDQAFQWKNSAEDAVDQSCFFKEVYIEDDETVSKTDNNSARSSAGICIGFDADGVWVVPAAAVLGNSALGVSAANSLLANATAGAARPRSLAVAEARLIGRLAGGNVAGLTAAQVNALLGSSHIVVAAGIHVWAGGAAATDSIAVVGLLAGDVIQTTLVARAGAEVLELAVNDAGNDQIDLTLSANGTDGTTKVAYSVLRAIA